MAELGRQSLSPDNPWPGLDPFDEADRDYFHGRAAEAAELLRRVRREPLTVLFGRSGLGKTSLLKAGLFPLLRAEDYLPVYVRLDHAAAAPEPRDQVFRALAAACAAEGVQALKPDPGESLWSFFHRRDAEFWSARNRPVTPVVLFDQFEEVFTAGQETEAARARSATFLAELADLVENRPPEAVRQALEAEPMAARRFDFKRSTIQLLLSFREDFLAEIEELKDQMPSLIYNRFRLPAMTGAQAYEVITRAGGHLVDDDVARRILRLAWENEPSPPVDPAEFPRLEIDPALLSVVLSELSQKRLQADPPLDHITPALLAGADREILAGFYERGMAGLDPRVRAFVEDELITARGFRDSHAVEDALALPGVTAEALDTLVRRRLLRVDERQSVRRLELTHDVLTRVVRESRDGRRAREAEAAAKARERAARLQQRRNRRNAELILAGALVLAVLLGLAGWFASTARKEEKRANALLHEAETARWMSNADRLQDVDYAASLLVNLEAMRNAPTLDTTSGLMRRFLSHPHLAAFLVGHPAEVLDVVWSPDGKRLASASEDATVTLWDVKSRRALATLAGHRGEVWSLAWSPDGKRLASGSGDGSVILWDAGSHRKLATLAGHRGGVTGVAWSPDGKRLASASEDRTVILWEVDGARRLATLAVHQGGVSAVAWSPDGRRLASASQDRTVILWDLDRLQPLATLAAAPDQELFGLAFSPDGKQLASALSGGAVNLWDVASHQRLASLMGRKEAVVSVAWSPDGKRLASAGMDRSVTVWDVASRSPVAALTGHKKEILKVAWSPDGTRLASASADRTVALWDLDHRKLQTHLKGLKSMVRSFAWSRDGRRLSTAGIDATVVRWDVRSRRPLTALERNEHELWGTHFSPDGKRLASLGKDAALRVWDAEGRRPPTTLEGNHGAVAGVAWSPDGKRLAAGGMDKALFLWDVESHRLLCSLAAGPSDIVGVAWSPDGKRLALAHADATVSLWDVERRRRVATLRGHKRKVFSVAWSPEGKRLASASEDATVILWDTGNHKRLATLEGHKGPVFGLAWSPDGQRLASASGDQTVILWDVAAYRPLVVLDGYDGSVVRVSWSPDGKSLASASTDGAVTLWHLDPDALPAEACRTAGHNLTCEEWRNNIEPDKPYHKTCEALPGPPGCG